MLMKKVTNAKRYQAIDLNDYPGCVLQSRILEYESGST
jgi:hypothetical protein